MRYVRYILNSAVVTSPGTYFYRLIDVEAAKRWLAKGEFQSTIRYAETAEALEKLTGVPIPVNPIMIEMETGDTALVFRLVFPVGTPRIAPEIKGMLTPQFITKNCEIGILEKVA